jgi:hypothetical protein
MTVSQIGGPTLESLSGLLTITDMVGVPASQ